MTIFDYLEIDEVVEFDRFNPIGFEKVLGRKFKQFDFRMVFDEEKMKGGLGLIDKTKAEIKLKDREIEETKIDTHPRYLIGKITPTQSLEYSKNGKKCFHNYICKKTVKLVIIL